MYFLLAMLAYTFYSKTRRNKYLGLTLLAFLFSLLAKAQAVTLPVVLILIDYLLARKPDARIFLEKVPFFILSLVFGYVAILAQDADGSVNSLGLTVFESLFYAHYSIWVYLYKLVLPVNLTCLYEYPVTAGGGIPWYIYISPVILPILAFVLLKTWKKQPPVFFGLLFFLVVIFPVLQFLPVGRAIVAERYTYIPYIGLFIVMAVLFSWLKEKLKTRNSKNLLNYTGVGALLVLCLLTFNRTKVWGDSVSLWTDVMEKNPVCMSAYINRSYMYIQYKQYDKALKDCDEGLAIDSTQFKLHINKGTVYRHLGRYEEALHEFSAALRKNPQSADSYLDRGIIYTDGIQKYDSGIADFRRFLKFRPDHQDGNFNMGVALYKNQEYDSSLHYLAKTLEISPGFPNAYYIRALVYAAKQDFAKAYENGATAQSMGYSVNKELMEGWRRKANIVLPDLR
jgi:tetratricopeptide (TPR) repeat protein